MNDDFVLKTFNLPSFHDRLLLFITDLNDVFAEHFLRGPRVELVFRLGHQVAWRHPAPSVRPARQATQPPVGRLGVEQLDLVALLERQSVGVGLGRRVVGNRRVDRELLQTDTTRSVRCCVSVHTYV